MALSSETREDSNTKNRPSFCWPHIDRWLGLSAAMIMMGCNGLTYTYAVYSEFIKKKLHYSQENTDDLGAAKDFGSVMGLASGLFYFLFPPWVSVFIGAILHLFGYLMILLTLTGRLKASFWLLCFYFAIGTGGDNWVDTACIMTSLESFEDYRGTAIGILKSQLGLSAAIFVMVYEAFLDSSVLNFLVLITFVPTILYFALAFLIRPFLVYEKDIDESDTTQRFQMVSVFVVVLGVFLMGSMTLKETLDLDGTSDIFLATIMLFVVAVMLVIPLLHKPLDLFRAAFCMRISAPLVLDPVCTPNIVLHKTRPDDLVEEAGMDETEEAILLKRVPGLSMEHCDLAFEAEAGSPISVLQDNANMFNPSLRESLTGIDFWLITFVVSSGAGSGLAVINNFAQIGNAVESNGVDVFVGIISIWSCFGRLVSGYGSDLMMSAGYSRPICLLISQTAMCLCCLLLSTGSTLSLFIGSAVIGMAYGSFWTLTPTVISEVFGLRQVATLYKFLGLGPTIAGYLLSAKVLGLLYDKETLFYQQQLGDEHVEANACYGRRCFGFGLLSLAFVCLLGVFACLWFAHRTKRIYLRMRHQHVPSSERNASLEMN